MIEVPAGWQARFGANLVLLAPPGGGGRVRYQERLPLRSFAALVAEELAGDPDFRAGRRSPILPGSTLEGEHSAWQAIPGTRLGARAARFFGAVVLDDATCLLDTLVIDPARTEELEAAARALLAGLTFGLGVRRRRFLHEVPAGWQALPSGLTTIWYPLDYPRRRATLTVFPASPLGAGGEGHERFLGGVGPVRVEPVRAASGLTGHSYAAAGGGRHKEVVVFDREPYRYTLLVESDEGARTAAREALHRVADSVEPIPSARHRPIDAGAGEAAAALGETWRD